MTKFVALALGVALGVLGVVPAIAAGPAANGYDWKGFYAGIFGGVGTNSTFVENFAHVGVLAGAGTTINNFYLGAEGNVFVEASNGGSPYLIEHAQGVFGVVFNASYLVYVAPGVGYENDTGTLFPSIAVGAQAALTDHLSLKGQYELDVYPADYYHVVDVGLTWKF